MKNWQLTVFCILGTLILIAPALSAQTLGDVPVKLALPDAPQAKASQAPPAKDNGMMAKFRDDLSHPLTPAGKAKRAFTQMLFPGIPATAAAAGIGMASDTKLDRDYGMGGEGFVRRWGSTFGTNAVDLFVGDFVLASALHQDPRYHPCKKAGFGNRLGYAISRFAVTYSDSGKQQFNASDVFGTLAGAGASTGWHHSSDRSGAYFAERYGWATLTSVGFNIVKEFIFYRNYERH